jgi:Tfp pilus assembly protein PilO
MKSRKLLIIILIAALLVVYYLVGTGYLKQRNQKATLASQIAAETETLALVPLPPADLEQRLADAQDGLDAVNNTFVVDTNYTRIVNKILRLASEIGVKAIPLSTQPWTIETVLGQDYSVFRVDMAVTGNFTQLVNFLNRLENGDTGTLIIEYLTVDRVPGSAGGESSAGSITPINADVRIAVYASPTTK